MSIVGDLTIGPRPHPLPIVQAAQVKRLGTIGGVEYVEVGDREYALDPADTEPSFHARRQDGSILIVERWIERLDGNSLNHTRHKLATPVRTGTHAALVAAAEERAQRAARRLTIRPLDLLAETGLRRTAVIGTALDPGTSPVNGRELVGWLEDRGVRLSLTAGGRLLAEGGGGRIPPKYRQVVEVAERLLVDYLSGSPLLCELDHGKAKAPEAVTIVFPGVPACAEHAHP